MKRSPEHGQATVELALTLPVVCIAMLLVLQAAIVLRAQLLVVHAARATARVAAVEPSLDADGLVRRAAPGLARSRVSVRVFTTGDASEGFVHVAVSDEVKTDVPIVGPLVGNVTVTAHAAMPDESG